MNALLRVCAASILLSSAATVARAQACLPPATPMFEFQVERPAAYTGDTTRLPRPATKPYPREASFVVQFIVDTLGRPEVHTFKVLRSPTPEAADSARAAVVRWTFRPALHRGCLVRQLFQAAVAH